MSDGHEDALASHEADLGRYTLHGQIAAGGMATVHLGRLSATAGFSKTVAIKRLHPQYAKDPEFRQMFVEEARLASRIRHPNVVPPLDVVATDGELFLIMEYVHGESLSRLWKGMNAKNERVPHKIAAALIVGVLHGLHAAHEAKDDQGEPLGIVHRDVSPQNILVGTDGVARVLDFGIAKAANRVQTTRENEVKGKLPYMAPEQFSKTAVSRRTDIYAASVVLWEVLTGRRLFEAEEQSEIFASIMRAQFDAPRTLVKDVPPELDRLVMRGLSRDPDARFATAREMALALEEAMPLATASVVGAWVEEVAAESLGKRGKQLADVESIPSRQVLEPTPPPPVSGRVSARLTSTPPPLPTSRDAQTRAWRGAPPSTKPSAATTSAGAHATKERRGGNDLGFVLFILGAAALALFLALPAIVKSSLISRAAGYGVTLNVEDVELSPRAIRLVGVTASAAEVPGVVVRVPRVELGLELFAIRRASAMEAAITLDGPVASVIDAGARWETSHGALRDTVASERNRVDVESLHVTWTKPFGEGTRLEAENAHLDITRKEARKLGDDLELVVPLMKLTTKDGSFGPWRAELTREPLQTVARVRFDSTGAASAVLTFPASGLRALQIDVAPSLLADIGIPLGPRGARVDVTTRATLSPSSQLESTASITFTGLLLEGASAPVDAKFDARLTGNVTKPLQLTQGALALGQFKANVTGAVQLSAAGISCDLTWKSVPRPCDARPPSSLTGTFIIDSKNLGSARAAIVHDARCAATPSP